MKCNRESLYINGAYGNRHTQINIKCTRFVIIHGKNRLLTARTNIALKRKYILQNKRHEKHQAFAKILTEFSIWSTKTRCSKHLSVQHNFTSKYGQSHALAQSGLFDWRSLFCDFAARQDNWQKKKKTQDAIHTRLFPLHRRTAAAFCWRHQCNPSGDIVVSYARTRIFLWPILCNLWTIEFHLRARVTRRRYFGCNFVGTHVQENVDIMN